LLPFKATFSNRSLGKGVVSDKKHFDIFSKKRSADLLWSAFGRGYSPPNPRQLGITPALRIPVRSGWIFEKIKQACLPKTGLLQTGIFKPHEGRNVYRKM
jgi:hypothetical protein